MSVSFENRNLELNLDIAKYNCDVASSDVNPNQSPQVICNSPRNKSKADELAFCD